MGHGHHHHSTGNIRFAFFLNLLFTLIEIAGGLYTNSVAILSDALHDLGDSIALGLSWFLENVSRKKRDQTFTYGYRRFSLLAAFINGLVLIIGSVFILSEAIPRLSDPPTPDVDGMLGLAILGILFNGFAVLKLREGHSLNEKTARLHLMEDVLGWIGVLMISIVMKFTTLPILDPLFSIGFTLFILYRVIINFRKTINIFLQAKPEEVDVRKLEEDIRSIRNILSFHDLHLWTMDGEYFVVTIHLVIPDQLSEGKIRQIKHDLRELFRNCHIDHATIEIERESERCELVDC
jgi:cobalt-zinc-cadmium efflux system protein